MSDEGKKLSIGCGSIPFGMLGVLFVGLKLTHYIDWSWWFVLMPFYIPCLLGLTTLFVILLLCIIGACCGSSYRSRWRY